MGKFDDIKYLSSGVLAYLLNAERNEKEWNRGTCTDCHALTKAKKLWCLECLEEEQERRIREKDKPEERRRRDLQA